MIHQSKSRSIFQDPQSTSKYFLGPSQTSKVEFFTEIVFGYKPLTVFLKISKLDV